MLVIGVLLIHTVSPKVFNLVRLSLQFVRKGYLKF